MEALEHVPEAVCVLAPSSGEIIHANKRFGRSIVEVSVSQKDAPLHFVDNFISTEDRPRFNIAIARALEVASKPPSSSGEAGSDMDDWLATPVVKDCDTLAVGSSKAFPIWRRYDWALSVMPDGNLLVSGRMTTVVSEEKKAGEKDLIDFLNKAPIAMHWLSGTGHVLWANETEMNVLGYTAEEYIGQPIMNFCPDEKELVLEIFKTLGSGNAIKDVPVRFRTKSGEIKDLLIDSNVNWNTDGSFKHTRCFIRDDTARKVREAKLEQMAVRDKEVAEQKDEFVRKTFHEIRTPCHLLGHLLQTYAEATTMQEKDSTFNDIQNQVYRLSNLVDDSVDATLFESGQVPVVEKHPFSIVDLLNNICHRLEKYSLPSTMVKHLISYASQPPSSWAQGLQVGPDVHSWFSGDEKKVSRVVTHLLDNAIKFTTEGKVSMELNLAPGGEGEDTLVFLTVRDDGPGMNEAQVQMAFSKYWQDTSRIKAKRSSIFELPEVLPQDGKKAQALEALMQRLDTTAKKGRSKSESGGSQSHGSATLDQQHSGSTTQDEKRETEDSVSGLDLAEVQGLGVGLNVINNIVQCMGGSVDFESNQNGTTFVVTLSMLPCADPTATGTSSSPAGSSPGRPDFFQSDTNPSPLVTPSASWYNVEDSPVAIKHLDLGPSSSTATLNSELSPAVGLVAMASRKPHLLVVDDNMICQKVLCSLVKKLGCTCDVACNGLEAFQMVITSTGLYDLIFMDLRMPVLDGMQATKSLREYGRAYIPIVAFTAEVGAEVREECMGFGFDGFIAKPAGKASVKAEIDRLVLNIDQC